MIRLLKLLILIIVALVVVLLSIANRHHVTVSFDPFSPAAPEISFAAPLFLVLFGAVAIGVLVGGIAAWAAQHHNRKELRRARKEIKTLKSDAVAARNNDSSVYPVLRAPDRAA